MARKLLELNCKCVACGRLFHRKTSKIMNRTFCSRTCFNSSLRPEVLCLNCGKKFRGKNFFKFCSFECVQKWRLKHLKGSLGPWVCPQCYKTFSKYFAPQNEHPFHFCSPKCRYQWMQRERHHNWRRGVSRQPYSFNFDEKLKLAIKERDDFQCQLCYSSINLVIHHINYNKLDSSEENLLTLCNSCNSKVNYNRHFWEQYFGRQLDEAS